MAMAAMAAMEDEILDKQLHRHVGCMAGFLHLFDRPAAGRRAGAYPMRRLTSASASSAAASSWTSSPSAASERSESSVTDSSFPPELPPPPSPLPFPVFEFREGPANGPWRLREAPRLSLDSKLRPRDIRTGGAGNAGDDGGRRSPSVVARLMGLDLPVAGDDAKPAQQLRRSSSESRARFVDPSFFEKPPPPPPETDHDAGALPFQRRSFFDAREVFPEKTVKRATVSGEVALYGEVDRRLRGRAEPSRDLDTIKQIFEALHYKALLHPDNNGGHGGARPPVVLMKPSPRPHSPPPRRMPRSPEPAARIPAPAATRRRTPPRRSPQPKPRSPDRKPRKNSGTAAAAAKTGIDPGRCLLERCDRLLTSIAAFTAGADSSSVDQQPSPVSVLDADSSFLGSPPLAAVKRAIDFSDPEDDDLIDYSVSVSDADPDYAYVAEIVQLHSHGGRFDTLEKRRRRPAGELQRLHRRTLFDAATEALDRCRDECTPASTARVWAEVRRAREPVTGAGGDLNEVTCNAIRRDLAMDESWKQRRREVADIVLNVERLVFKDLVADAIRAFADAVAGDGRAAAAAPCRKLLF